MMRQVANWFEPVHVSERYRNVDYLVLCSILFIGAALRFWNLGYAGLHGDEDIMALAARGVLEHGIPILPSEMVYVRALPHTFIIAGSICLFGDTEWAIRLPSAIVGSFLGLLAFFMGKRFLEPKLNLAFVAMISFLPAMIDIAQTGRMYVFFVACLLGFAALLFRWEENGSAKALLLASAVWLLALSFHALAIFAAPLFLFPGISRLSWRMVMQGCIAFLSSFVAFRYLASVISSFRPDRGGDTSESPGDEGDAPLEIVFSFEWSLIIGILLTAGSLVIVWRALVYRKKVHLLPAILLLGIGLVACGFLHYHLGGIALLLGVVAWFRSGERNHGWLVLVLAIVAVIAVIQVQILHSSGQFPGRTLIGALVGTPSIWPLLRFAEFSPLAMLLYVLAIGFMLLRFVQGNKLPVHFLYFVMAVWGPLFGIGLFLWYPSIRYMLGIVPFFLLVFTAALSYVLHRIPPGDRLRDRPALRTFIVLITVCFIINPVAVERVASNDYRTHPDHKGAADFITQLGLGPDDIIIAEDSINQTYYLGRVNYRLKSSTNHARFVDGIPYGLYTGTPFITSGAELEVLIKRPGVGGIFIIGSGEGEVTGEHRRGDGIDEVLESDRFEVVYRGRDRKTMVWKVID